MVNLVVGIPLEFQRGLFHEFLDLYESSLGTVHLFLEPREALLSPKSTLFGKSVFEVFQSVRVLMQEFAKVCEGVEFTKYEPDLPYRSDPALERF